MAEILVQGDRTRLHPESPGCRQRVSSKARFPARARMRNAPVAKFNVVQRRVTGIPSFRFAVRSGFLVRPKLGWLLTKNGPGEILGRSETPPLRNGRLGSSARWCDSAIQASLLGLFCPLYSCPFASVRGSRESTAGLAETLQATGRQSEHLMKTAG